MKKYLSLFLTVAIVAMYLAIPAAAATAGDVPSGAYLIVETGEYAADKGVINSVVADFNFDDAVLDFSGYVTYDEEAAKDVVSVPRMSYVPVTTANAAQTDKTVTLQTAFGGNPSKDAPYKNQGTALTDSQCGSLYRPYTVAANEDGSNNIALAPADRKRQARFDMIIGGGVAPSAPAELVYLDFKVRRVNATLDDPVAITLKDSKGKKIAALSYNQKNYPQLQANVNYGNDAFTAEAPVTNYCNDGSWQCVRFAMDFTSQTFKMYVGNTWEELKPFISSVESYTMAAQASDFAKMYIGDKGSLGIDDIAVYTVVPPIAPAASDVSMTGKPNLNETLACTYGTYSCENNIAEGDSYYYWETADDAQFIAPTAITQRAAVKAGDTVYYTLTEKETGKYVRCVIVPVNATGTEGEKAYSNVSEYKVNHTEYSVYPIGQFRGDNFEWKAGRENNLDKYAGGVTITSSKTQPVKAVVVAAWYETVTDEETGLVQPKLVSIKTKAVEVDASEAESGYISESFNTDFVYTVTDNNTPKEDKRLKVMLVNSLDEMIPLADYVTRGGSPLF